MFPLEVQARPIKIISDLVAGRLSFLSVLFQVVNEEYFKLVSPEITIPLPDVGTS
jgi:hypothetical protein